MKSSIRSQRGALAAICCFVLLAFLSLLPMLFRTSAGGKKADESADRHSRFGDYDIRKDKKASERIVEFRSRSSKNEIDVANERSSFARGEEKLHGKLRNLKVEYNDDLKVPEVIGTDVRQGKEFLTPPGIEKRSEVLKRFLRENDELTGVRAEHVSRLKLTADYKNPENDLSLVELEQELNGVPVFRGSVKAGFTKRNEIVRIINNLAPGVDESLV
ncbi:MAG: hypothetical protein ACJ72Z_08120, partial [Pyrinomonadaceae bacterium]